MNTALALKSEVVLGLQLVSRHRAPRLALLLTLSLIALVSVEGSADASLEVRRRALALIAGSLCAVAASRLLAHGGPLASVRRTASTPFLAPAGRLTGALLFAVPPLFAAAFILLVGRWGLLEATRTTLLLSVYAATVGAVVMALTPLAGASAAAALGLISVLVGGIPPSQIAALLESWPIARGALVLAWNTLPLPWRAYRWLETGALVDPALLLLWVGIGLGLAAFVAVSESR